MEDQGPDGFTLGIILLVTVSVLLLIFFMILKIYESLYLWIFKKPPFVHFYFLLRRMPPYGKFLLENEFAFYRSLSKLHKRYFSHRVQSFISHYKFVGRDELEVTAEMKIKVAAT